MIRLLLLLGMLFPMCLWAQYPVPDYGLAFPQNEVPTVRITLPADSLDELISLGTQGSEREFEATFRFESQNLTTTIQQVGFRLRGNTSLQASKKSFKISFNTFVEGGKWQGLEKLNLNGSHNDPSMIRAKLSWDILRDAGLTAARTGFVKLYINNEYRGLYTNVEHIDEQFCKLNIDQMGSGDLFKCLYPAKLNYLGSNPEWYKVVSGNRRIYELTNNQYLDDYSAFARFVGILNQTDLQSLPCSLETVFNVDRFLRQAAMDVLLSNWDGYSFNKNNFYLYQNKHTGLFEYIPYDLDNTFGIDWFGIDWTNRNVYSWNDAQEELPLIQRLLQVPEYRAAYTAYMRRWLNGPFHYDSLNNRVNAYLDLIAPAVQSDPYHSLDYGYTFSDFQNSGNQAAGGHVPYGILPYVQQRRNAAFNQLDTNTVVQAVHGFYLEHDFPELTTSILHAYGSPAMAPLPWQYSFNGSVWMDGGWLNDLSGDGHYTTTVSFDPAQSESVLIRVNANPSTTTCQARRYFLQADTLPIRINELMAQNTSAVMNDMGQYSDWIELYNTGPSAYSLNGKFLSDNPADPQKWAFPNISMPSGGFTLWYADGKPELNRSHVGFSLDASGESLRMYQLKQGGLQRIDRVDYSEQTANTSWGREVDGVGEWIVFPLSTPNASNQSVGIESVQGMPLYVWPNPSQGLVHINRYLDWYRLYNGLGQEIQRGQHSNQISMHALPAGLYTLVSPLGSLKLVLQKP